MAFAVQGSFNNYDFNPFWHVVGDLKPVRLQMDLDVGGHGNFQRDFTHGIRARADLMPTTVRLDAADSADPSRTEEERLDIIRRADHLGVAGGLPIISRRLMEMIERHDPGVHQFFPMQVQRIDGSDAGIERYGLNICTRLKGDVAEEYSTTVRKVPFSDEKESPHYNPEFFYISFKHASPKFGDRVAFWHDVVKQFALWWSDDLRHVFASNELMSEIEQNEIIGWEQGWKYLTCLEIDRDGNVVRQSKGRSADQDPKLRRLKTREARRREIERDTAILAEERRLFLGSQRNETGPPK
ncbi:MAG: hypothetical protein H7Y08_01035 [Rhizobiaceae bacterium]|nr:hypothetical protein [Rhizobiaceae bacterium]